MKWLLRGLIGTVFILALLAAGIWMLTRERVGTSAQGERLTRMQNSAQWKNGQFTNPLKRVDGPFARMMRDFFFGGSADRVPDEPIDPIRRKRSDFDEPPPGGLRITWLGHSTLLIEIDGARVLVDPVWGERSSPLSFAGPKRFYAPPLPLAELPDVDAIVISHDHYDHLDFDTVKALRENDARWVTPLGVGAHLEHWGIPKHRITELDWWEDTRVGSLTLTCTPARHFSGRSALFADQNATLWSGWAIAGPTRRVFYSGDTALHPEFADIGKRLGPFDVGIFEVGAYNAMWADVHLGPEQAVLAHQLVGSRVMFPVHWGLFDLALHSWTEPIERTLVAAKKHAVEVASPRPGGSFEWSDAPLPAVDRWWPNVPWQTVDEAPSWSSSVDDLLNGYR